MTTTVRADSMGKTTTVRDAVNAMLSKGKRMSAGWKTPSTLRYRVSDANATTNWTNRKTQSQWRFLPCNRPTNR